jgi:hypothetical protein
MLMTYISPLDKKSSFVYFKVCVGQV